MLPTKELFYTLLRIVLLQLAFSRDTSNVFYRWKLRNRRDNNFIQNRDYPTCCDHYFTRCVPIINIKLVILLATETKRFSICLIFRFALSNGFIFIKIILRRTGVVLLSIVASRSCTQAILLKSSSV